jgi:hypothetical protein
MCVSGEGVNPIVLKESFDGIEAGLVLWSFANTDSESYRQWHPAHVGIEYEHNVLGLAGPGSTYIFWEYVLGRMAAYRFRNTPHDQCPVPITNPAAAVSAVLDTDEKPMGWFITEVGMHPKGVDITLTWLAPNATPDAFVEAHSTHWREEMHGLVNKAVPFQIQRLYGYTPSAETLQQEVGELMGALKGQAMGEVPNAVRARATLLFRRLLPSNP